jgi:hypothetical protein
VERDELELEDPLEGLEPPTDAWGAPDMSGLTPVKATHPRADWVRFDRNRRKRYLDLRSSGVPHSQAAKMVGVGRNTIWRHAKVDPFFAEAVKRAEASAVEIVEDALFQAASSGNVTAMVFYLERRDPARWGKPENRGVVINATATAVTGAPASDPERVDVGSLDPLELRRRALALLHEAAAEHDELTFGGAIIDTTGVEVAS